MRALGAPQQFGSLDRTHVSQVTTSRYMWDKTLFVIDEIRQTNLSN